MILFYSTELDVRHFDSNEPLYTSVAKSQVTIFLLSEGSERTLYSYDVTRANLIRACSSIELELYMCMLELYMCMHELCSASKKYLSRVDRNGKMWGFALAKKTS